MSAKLTLDRFELIWYLQGAMSGSHLRWGIYEDFVNIVYPQLNDDERKFIHDIAIRDCSWHFEGSFVDKAPYERFKQMLACYDNDNRYIVEFEYKGEKGSKDTYLWDNEYYIDWSKRVNKDYITKINKKTTK